MLGIQEPSWPGKVRMSLLRVNKHNWEVVRLSDDHKPNRDSEKKRIIGCGGRIEKVKDEDGIPIGPWRVWLPRKRKNLITKNFKDWQ